MAEVSLFLIGLSYNRAWVPITGGLVRLSPPGYFTGAAGNGPSFPKKTGFSPPPTFRHMRGLPGLLLLLAPPFFSYY